MSDPIERRYERAQNIVIEDVRVINPDSDDPTIFEIDALNEDGERRENMTVIPGLRYENTKDLQFRHDEEIVGKYTMALAQANDRAREELADYLEDKRARFEASMSDIQEKRNRIDGALRYLDNGSGQIHGVQEAFQ